MRFWYRDAVEEEEEKEDGGGTLISYCFIRHGTATDTGRTSTTLFKNSSYIQRGAIKRKKNGTANKF